MLRSLSRRALSTIRSAEVVTNSAAGKCIDLRISQDSNVRQFVVPLVWFRDHCRGDSCYNHSTNQRKSKLTDIFREAEILSSSSVKFDSPTQKMTITWKDGAQTTFTSDLIVELLVRQDRKPFTQVFRLWDQSTLQSPPTINKSNFSFPDFSKKFADFGFVCVDGVEKTAEATKKFASEIAPIHDTFYGDFWVFNNNAADQEAYHEDTAYSSEEIGPHTDGTYFPQSPGIQVFHCLRPADKGGETILVDGFSAAQKLKESDPEAYRILSTIPVDHHYIEKGDHSLFSWSPLRPIIELNAEGDIVQIRFNPYDRAPLRLSDKGFFSTPENILSYYKAYQSFSRLCHDPSSSIKVSLQPGTVIFIDNLRVLHARASFSGYRQMCGCYLSRDNLMAKARLHIEEEKRLQV